jgi:AraC-like DNA-binding protein
LVCGWTASVEGTHTLVPDGCVDVLWTSQGSMWVCGPETQAWTPTLPAGTRAVGVRYRPGVIADVLRVDVGELRDRLVDGIARALGRQAWDVCDLADAASLSARQLHRRCRAAFGYGPSTLRAVLRLQRFMAMARRAPRAGLAGLARRAGFSDQAHLARECRRFAGLTPTALLAGEAPDWHGGGAPWWAAPDVRSVQDGRGPEKAGLLP